MSKFKRVLKISLGILVISFFVFGIPIIEKSIKSLAKHGICTLITPSNFTTNN